MSNALEQASLIMVPSGYEDGTLGSLKPTDGTGDFTFSRGSDISATRVNADGYIEKGYENLLYPSNDFSGWQNINSVLTPNQAGYDGTNDAWLFEATSAQGRRYKNISDTGVLTYSIYAKSGTADILRLRIDAATDMDLRVDLSDGSFVSGTFIDYNIEDAGNGWWRVSVTQNITSPVYIFVYSYDVGTIYIQDAMINQGLVAYPYKETTTAPVAGGILEDMPRLDYSNGSCPALLLEPQRTNNVTSSEYFQSGWNNLGAKVSFENNTTDTLSPEGKYNATKLIKNLSGNPTLRMDAVTAGSSFVFTCWAKAGTSNLLELDISDAATTTFTLTNQWQRFEVKTSSAANNFVDISLKSTTNIGDYFYIWGAQVEQGSYPTSYIPTYGVSQTRLKDKTDRGSNLAYTGDYTLFMEFELTKDTVYLLTNTSLAYRLFLETDDAYFKLGSSNVFFQNMFNWRANLGTNIKMAFTKNGTTANMFVNGTKYTPSTNTLSTGNEVLDWRYLNYSTATDRQEQAYIKQLIEFQTALSEDECIALTTI